MHLCFAGLYVTLTWTLLVTAVHWWNSSIFLAPGKFPQMQFSGIFDSFLAAFSHFYPEYMIELNCSITWSLNCHNGDMFSPRERSQLFHTQNLALIHLVKNDICLIKKLLTVKFLPSTNSMEAGLVLRVSPPLVVNSSRLNELVFVGVWC